MLYYFGLGDARPYFKRKSDNLNKVLRPREKYSKSIFCCKWQLVETFIIFSKVEPRKKNESRLVGLNCRILGQQGGIAAKFASILSKYHAAGAFSVSYTHLTLPTKLEV